MNGQTTNAILARHEKIKLLTGEAMELAKSIVQNAGYSETARVLNEDGYTTSNGTPWTREAVRRRFTYKHKMVERYF